MLTAVQVDFKAPLVRPTRSGNDHILALEIDSFMSEEPGLDDVCTEYPFNEFVRFGTLYRKR